MMSKAIEDRFEELFNEVEVGFIKSPADIARLTIIDWSRYKSYWESPMRAVDVIGGYCIGFRYSIMRTDLREFPERDDFPEWGHVGSDHNRLGRLYWNFFKYMYHGEINYHDRP